MRTKNYSSCPGCLCVCVCVCVYVCVCVPVFSICLLVLFGASLSEPYTSVTALRKCVCTVAAHTATYFLKYGSYESDDCM